MQTSTLGGAGGQNQLIQQLMELARANAIQADSAQAASSTQSTQGADDSQSFLPAATPASGTTPSDMFSGQTLGALTSLQEGASNLRQAINSDVANQIISQLGSDGGISLAQIENALGGTGSTTSSATSSNTVSTLDASTSSNTVSTLDGLASAFASLDTNGDGELSVDELTNALNQMTGPGQVAGHHGHHHHHGGDGHASDGSLTLSDIDNALSALTGSLNGASGSGSTTSGSTSSNTVSTLDGSSPSGAASTASNSTSTNTVSTLDGLTTVEIAQALQAFLSSLAQSQAANLAALGQTTNPNSVTA